MVSIYAELRTEMRADLSGKSPAHSAASKLGHARRKAKQRAVIMDRCAQIRRAIASGAIGRVDTGGGVSPPCISAGFGELR